MNTEYVCYFCKKPLDAFLTTPIVEVDDELFDICEICADEKFPGWNDEDDS